ncbi:hypothetical protein PHET_06040 [Paragonimus heterotremus]|uniref:Hexosyltransferase n=1 Tax=Paragonimus heterotremus TaxID=100268 RepID=A0A8J4SNN0_9TREM|nr:hypothetical protein PHET_06040 [Paragonimus heterotremus]
MGRFNTDRCGIKPMVIQQTTCTNPNKVLVFHLIADTRDQAYLQTKMNDWNLPNVAIHFYNIAKYMDLVRSVQSGHYSGSRSYIKLYLPEILPSSVEKVIMLDADMLVNRHICDLWAHFDRFNETQAFAMVPETSPYYWSETGRKYWPSLGPGYNAGLVLFHLSRLRSMAWNSLWNENLQYLLSKIDILPTAEQDVLNRIGHVQPQLLYTLPCTWNVQMGVLSVTNMCPVTWSMTSEAAETAKALAIEELALIHFNAPQKPENVYPKRLRWVDDAHIYQPMTKKHLVARYLNVYYAFRDIPGQCFA